MPTPDTLTDFVFKLGCLGVNPWPPATFRFQGPPDRLGGRQLTWFNPEHPEPRTKFGVLSVWFQFGHRIWVKYHHPIFGWFQGGFIKFALTSIHHLYIYICKYIFFFYCLRILGLPATRVSQWSRSLPWHVLDPVPTRRNPKNEWSETFEPVDFGCGPCCVDMSISPVKRVSEYAQKTVQAETDQMIFRSDVLLANHTKIVGPLTFMFEGPNCLHLNLSGSNVDYCQKRAPVPEQNSCIAEASPGPGLQSLVCGCQKQISISLVQSCWKFQSPKLVEKGPEKIKRLRRLKFPGFKIPSSPHNLVEWLNTFGQGTLENMSTKMRAILDAADFLVFWDAETIGSCH